MFTGVSARGVFATSSTSLSRTDCPSVVLDLASLLRLVGQLLWNHVITPAASNGVLAQTVECRGAHWKVLQFSDSVHVLLVMIVLVTVMEIVVSVSASIREVFMMVFITLHLAADKAHLIAKVVPKQLRKRPIDTVFIRV